MNRLTGAQEVNGVRTAWQATAPSPPFWQQMFSYDRFGNRAVVTANTTSTMIGPNPVISTTNNRITPRSSEYYYYDDAGNMTKGQSGDTLDYDAENKLVQYQRGATQSGGANYFYDGDGRRIKKATPSETQIFVYNIGGQLVAEYTTSTPLINGTNYLTNDTLGSPRVTTKADGSIRARHDYLPFGEELYASTGNRTIGQKYDDALVPADKTRQKFTSKERDNETGLDYFFARYYSSTQGRFTSADPFNIVLEVQAIAEIDPRKAQAKFNAYLHQPQQWNRYVYVANNPLKYVDPTGEQLWLTGTDDERKQPLDHIKKMVGSEAAKYITTKEFCTDRGMVTIVDYDHSRDALASKGGELGVYISDLIDNKNVVEYRIAKEFDTNEGHFTTASFGGAATVGREESLTGRTQIFVHPNGSNIAQERAGPGTFKGGLISSNGRGLDFYDDIVDAHEFGHAYANAVEGISLRTGETGSNPRALQLENYVRARRVMSNRRTGH